MNRLRIRIKQLERQNKLLTSSLRYNNRYMNYQNDIIEKHIKQKEKELPKPKTGYKNASVKSYEQTLGHLKDFEREFECVLDFDLDSEFYSNFFTYTVST